MRFAGPEGMFYINPHQSLNHAVVLVGYNSDYGYKIKNSWGYDWADSGFGWL